MATYDDSIATGSATLNAGDTQGALQVFLDVLDELGAKPTSEVLQLIGICWHMLGDTERATGAFKWAYEVATNDIDKGRIMRDWAMVPLTEGKLNDTRQYLDKSLALLGDNHVECAVTWGYIGRVHARSGNKLEACLQFRKADMILKREDAPSIYKLNILAHWMEVASLGERIKLAARAVPIAIKYANHRRLTQIALLVVRRPLA